MPAELTADEYQKALADKDNVNQSTIDNNATSTEIRYLSRIYLATGIEKYKDAALEGIRYLLKAQYPNGTPMYRIPFANAPVPHSTKVWSVFSTLR